MAATPRISNFSTSDGVILMSEVKERESRLFSCFAGPGGSKKRKMEAWDEVAVAFNSQTGGPKRTVDQLKKKFNNIKTEAKNKVCKAKHPPTGGGPPEPEMTLPQQMFFDMVGDAPNVVGIPGGIESEVTDVEKLLYAVEFPVPVSVAPVAGTSLADTGVTEYEEGRVNTALEVLPTKDADPQNVTLQHELQLFPAPGSKRNRNPRSDKVESQLRIETLNKEKEKIQAVLDYIKLKKQQAIEKHEAKMEILRLKKLELEKNNL